MKILFADEDWEIEVLVKVLRARHPEHEFELADSLEKARRAIWSTKFDILVLDIMLPANDQAVPNSSENAGLLSGLLLLDMIQNDSSCPNQHTKVIFLTGLPTSEHPKIKEAQLRFGEFFIRKPVHPDSLYDALLKASKG
jgi:CheY-like chemotaxis protein